MSTHANNDIFHLLHQKSRFIKKRMDIGLKKHNLYMSQWSILFCLNKFGEMTQTEIWTYLNVEAPTITRTLEKMENSGWIIRKHGADKRERIIAMTDKAVETYNIVIKQVIKMENELLLHFTDTEKQQLYHLLDKIES